MCDIFMCHSQRMSFLEWQQPEGRACVLCSRCRAFGGHLLFVESLQERVAKVVLLEARAL